MIGHLYTLLLASRGPAEPEPEPQPESSLLASGGPDPARPGYTTFHDDELLQIAVALITSGALECHR